MKKEILLRAESLHKKFSNGETLVHVLSGVNLGINEGSSLVITGASGAGKSTLLHVLSTLDRPTEGTVFYRGESLSTKNEDDLSKFRNRTMGFVFQFHNLLPEFTIVENVLFPSIIGNADFKLSRDRAIMLLNEMGLSERLNHKPSELSGGEQQRVAVARALEMSPQIIFADEPTGNLDSKNSRIVLELLLKLTSEQGVALIVVTHNENIKGMFDRSLTLRDGLLVEN
ncbi:MAG TPA: ABC transporter ATP-binding protein [bacterium]